MTRYKSQPGHGLRCTGTAHASKKVDKRAETRWTENWQNRLAYEVGRACKLWLERRGRGLWRTDFNSFK